MTNRALLFALLPLALMRFPLLSLTSLITHSSPGVSRDSAELVIRASSQIQVPQRLQSLEQSRGDMRFRLLPHVFDLEEGRHRPLWTPGNAARSGPGRAGSSPPRPLGSVCHASVVHEVALLRHRRAILPLPSENPEKALKRDPRAKRNHFWGSHVQFGECESMLFSTRLNTGNDTRSQHRKETPRVLRRGCRSGRLTRCERIGGPGPGWRAASCRLRPLTRP